jgi:hypothetical protein
MMLRKRGTALRDGKSEETYKCHAGKNAGGFEHNCDANPLP